VKKGAADAVKGAAIPLSIVCRTAGRLPHSAAVRMRPLHVLTARRRRGSPRLPAGASDGDALGSRGTQSRYPQMKGGVANGDTKQGEMCTYEVSDCTSSLAEVP
jgi:hypothetical protein